MTQPIVDVAAAVAAEVATGPDMTKSVTAVREVPKEGVVKLRFVGYVETGKHEKTIKGATKVTDRVELTFELSGNNYPANKDGKPMVIVVRENKSLNEKANFFKLFQAMNWQGKATHMAQLLGQGFLGTISHYTFKGSDGEVTIAQLRGTNGYTVRAPIVHDEEGEAKPVNVPAQITPSRVFFWNTPSKATWDSLFIDGEYEAREGKPAKSKNVIQNTIKSAVNFGGSPVETLLKTNGVPLDVPSADVPSDDGEEDGVTVAEQVKAVPQGKAADDILNGVV